MLAAELHGAGGGGDRHFEHRHDDVALGDARLPGVDGCRVHQLVGAHVEDDEVLALVVENDEADASGALAARDDQRSVDAFGRIEVGRDAGELVGAQNGRPATNARRAWRWPRPGWSPCRPVPCRNREPSMVSPKIGSLDARMVRPTAKLPTTVIIGLVIVNPAHDAIDSHQDRFLVDLGFDQLARNPSASQDKNAFGVHDQFRYVGRRSSRSPRLRQRCRADIA